MVNRKLTNIVQQIAVATFVFLSFLSIEPAFAQAEFTVESPKKIIAAVLEDFPPLYVLDKSGNPAGFAIDILDFVASETGIQIEYQITENWGEAMEAVRTGKADVIPGIGISPAREAEFAFTSIMETIPVSCFVRNNNYQIKGIEDLSRGYRTAVIDQSAAMTRMAPGGKINLVPFANIESALFQLLAGDVDAFVFPEPVLKKKMRIIGVEDRIKVVGKPLMELKRGYLLRKTDADLVQILNPVIRKFTLSSGYLETYNKSYGKPKPYWIPQRIYVAMSILIVIIILGMAVWRYLTVMNLNRLMRANITEREKAELTIKESHERLLTVLNSLDSIVYVADIKTHKLLFVNKYTKDIFGDIEGKTCWQVLQSGQSGPCSFCSNDKLFAPNGEPAGVYCWELQNTNNHRWYYIQDRAIYWVDGRIVRMEIATDITERKTMEEELLKAQKLESIGVLAGGIAHDFNNLLTAITNNLFLMKNHISPEEKVYEWIKATERASARAQGLTQQLLTFSKGGAPIKGVIDIRELVSESISIALRGSNVKCENLIPYDVWHVEADAGQINQAINNILINADQSMPEGGTITINCENVIIGAENSLPLTKGNYIKISIRDQGTGISEEHMPRIFDPYFSTKQKGSGLGLSSTYSIIKKHDGHISVESELGVGTAFNIYLPASMEKVDIKKTAEDAPIAGTGKVLIMDDDDLVRDSLGQMLISSGYEVEYAGDGKEAIDIYKNVMASDYPFDAVIMDLTIPGGIGGKEAIRELIKIDPHVKAIVSSGYSYDPIMSNYRDYGFRAVVQTI